VRDLALDKLDRITETMPLSALPEAAPKILAGQIRGRVVVDVSA
jgi:acrylyl-CoA reductase (NADPH)